MFISKNIFYFAQCFTKSNYQHASVKIMIKICQISIIIATCALALIFSIMSGFEEATYKKMQSIYPDMIINCDQPDFDIESWETIVHHNKKLIQNYTIQKMNQILISTQPEDEDQLMVIIKGVDPLKETLVSNIETKIISEIKKLSDILEKNSIMIGSKLAKNLDIKIGDTIYLSTLTTKPFLGITLQEHPVIVQGIFKTGIEDFDATLVYSNQNLYDQIFPDSDITHLHIRLTDTKFEQELKNILSAQIHLDIYSWKDLYPSLLSALKLEKWAMFLILMLIICVACMNIISVIFMYITQKQRDIAILLCMGMSKQKIQYIFILFSEFITIPAAICGLMLAAIIGIILQNYPCIKLPDNIYDTDYLPIKLELHIFCVILIVIILVSLITSWYATKNIKKLKIVELLKTI
jgi:lipoprotein-releasing system permease protein